jgi:type IV pilus assembly protein PilV
MNTRSKTAKTAKTGQTGFTLIELLVSLLILSFGLLGIGGMMGFTLKSNSSSYLKQLSVQSATNIIDRMRANSQAVIAGSYNVNNLVTSGAPTIPGTPATDCTTTACTSAQMAAYDSWSWLANDVAAQLPNGCASVTTAVSGTNTLVTVTVQWDDSPAQAKLGSATAASAAVSGHANLSRFVTQTLL